jgi:glycerol-3-phosphate acyltransferase PlsY
LFVSNSVVLALIALAAFLGHLYPLFFRFQGGKGVATTLGCLLALSWPTGLLTLCTWLFVAFIFRYSSLAAMLSALLAPAYLFYFQGFYSALIIALISALLLYRHRSNIVRLFQGDEGKIGR